MFNCPTVARIVCIGDCCFSHLVALSQREASNHAKKIKSAYERDTVGAKMFKVTRNAEVHLLSMRSEAGMGKLCEVATSTLVRKGSHVQSHTLQSCFPWEL